MGKLVVTEFLTVDGVFEDPGGSEGAERGGWAFEFDRGEGGDRFKYDELMAAEAQLFGRVTYEGFADAWPTREGPFAEKINSLPKYVVSSTLENPEWSNSTVIAPDGALDEVAALKERYEGDILVAGSGRLARTLLEAELVDELRLMVFPVVLGTGKRLFEGVTGPVAMRLQDSRPAGETQIITYGPK